MSMMDEKIPPMLASPGKPFDDPNWIFEIKWDGSRTIAFLSNTFSYTRLQDRRLKDITYQFPELKLLHKSIKRKEAILDGELVVITNGKPSYKNIMSRKHQQSKTKIEILKKTMPALFIAWDILYLDGKTLVDLPLIERKEILNSVIIENESLKISDFIEEFGNNLFDITKQKGLEGIMAKKMDSAYEMGKRSKLWLKIKNFITLNAVIMGYKKNKKALILGLYDDIGNLVPIGSCESGLTKKDLEAFFEIAKDITVPQDFYHFKDKNIQWIEPVLVCKVRFMEWSENMKMRAPTFMGFQFDVKPWECRF